MPEVPGAAVEVHTYNAMVGLHGRLRAQLPSHRFQPYADGLFGFTNIYTTSEVKGEDGCDEGCRLGSESQSSDFVLSNGAGAGVMIKLASRGRAPRQDVGVRYLAGGRADYLTEGSVRAGGGQVIRDFSRARTDRFGFYLGAVVGR